MDNNYDKINQLLSQANQSLLCGPGTECEKNKNNENLEKKYLDAKMNLLTAPKKYQDAEKNYYTQTLGVYGYNNVLETKLGDESTEEALKKITDFNENINEITKNNDMLEKLLKNHKYVEELYNDYIKKNEYLRTKVDSKTSDIVTNDRKTYYEIENYEILLKRHKLWVRIYYFILFLLTLYLLIEKNGLSSKIKILLILVFGLYPFLVDKIVFFIIKSIIHLYHLLPKNIYNSK